jgi:cell division initiation protein
MLSPLDIRQKEFRKGFRGYEERQVDNFMDEVANSIEDLLKENDQLRTKLVEAEERQQKYRELEEALKDTMVMAQKNAQDLKENADKEIKLLMQDAHQRAEILLQQAEDEANKKVDQAEQRVREVMEAYRQLQKQANVFKTQFRTFLQTQLELLSAEHTDMEAEPEREQAV